MSLPIAIAETIKSRLAEKEAEEKPVWEEYQVAEKEWNDFAAASPLRQRLDNSKGKWLEVYREVAALKSILKTVEGYKLEDAK